MRYIKFVEQVDIRETLGRRITKKRQEVADLGNKLREANAYLLALEDTFALLSQGEGEEALDGEPAFHHGSDVAKARDWLRKTGKPKHISEILRGIGKNNDKKARVSLRSTISNYVRKEQVFSRPGPNIFGLLEFGNSVFPQVYSGEPPDDFGDKQPVSIRRPTLSLPDVLQNFDPGISDDDVPF